MFVEQPPLHSTQGLVITYISLTSTLEPKKLFNTLQYILLSVTISVDWGRTGKTLKKAVWLLVNKLYLASDCAFQKERISKYSIY